MLTRETFTGPWAGLPVSWTDRNELDLEIYQADVIRCCQADVPGIYTAGTTGEFYAMELDEFQRVTEATVKAAADFPIPVMIGVTSTYTRGAERRAAFAAEAGADAIQVALPFWLPIDNDRLLPFFQAVSAASGHLPLSIYETTRCKTTLTLEQHRMIQQSLPNYLMVKANEGTIGCTVDGCRELSKQVNVFVGESKWRKLVPCGARGSCSSIVYWNPRVLLSYWQAINAEQGDDVARLADRFDSLAAFLGEYFGSRGFTDTAYDRLGAVTSGFLQTSLLNRAPYVSPTEDDVKVLQEWYREHFSEMLQL